jgi:lysozyme
MNVSKAGLDLIKDFEGYHKRLADGRCTTYYCPAGVLTLGYGCTEGIREGQIWTHDEAIEALKREISKFERVVNQAVTVDMTQPQYDACVSLAYNIGAAGFRRSSVLRYLNRGDINRAAKSFELWVNGGGRFLPGLLIRRKREAALFLTPDIPLPERKPDMPQKVDDTPNNAPVAEAVQSSRTITGAVVAGLGTVVSYADDAAQTLVDAAAQTAAWSPIQTFLHQAGVNVKGVGVALAAGGLAMVVGRRVSAAKDGKIG